MTKIKIVICSLLLLAILSGCRNHVESESHDSIFQVGIDNIEQVKVNEAFEVNGFIKNNSKRTVGISHGSGMFTYEIYTEDGDKIVPKNTTLVINDIGYMVELKSGEEYRNNGEGQRSKEYYEFVITVPGDYKVKMHVEFRMNNEGKQEQIKISSDFEEFRVK
jgi:signal peptidase I